MSERPTILPKVRDGIIACIQQHNVHPDDAAWVIRRVDEWAHLNQTWGQQVSLAVSMMERIRREQIAIEPTERDLIVEGWFSV